MTRGVYSSVVEERAGCEAIVKDPRSTHLVHVGVGIQSTRNWDALREVVRDRHTPPRVRERSKYYC